MSHPYSEAVFNYHVTNAWKKRKAAQEGSGEAKWWAKILLMLHADYEGKETVWRAWQGEA